MLNLTNNISSTLRSPTLMRDMIMTIIRHAASMDCRKHGDDRPPLSPNQQILAMQ
ncbi:MAG TPA: hypothetical protein VHV83_10515 [Armatimonadota bacterium]|nr:hypothetical protein [Armatimonadota bacterium]